MSAKLTDDDFAASALARAQRQADESRRCGDRLAAEVRLVLSEPHAYVGGRERAVLRAALAEYEAPAAPRSTLRFEVLAFLTSADRDSHAMAMRLLERVAAEAWS